MAIEKAIENMTPARLEVLETIYEQAARITGSITPTNVAHAIILASHVVLGYGAFMEISQPWECMPGTYIIPGVCLSSVVWIAGMQLLRKGIKKEYCKQNDISPEELEKRIKRAEKLFYDKHNQGCRFNWLKFTEMVEDPELKRQIEGQG